MAAIFKNIDDESLYEQLISRLYHTERAFIIRRHIYLHYAKTMPEEVTSSYVKVRSQYGEVFSAFEESLLWFITVELWSRFTANSAKGLRKLVVATNDTLLTKKYTAYAAKHEDVISYIDTQRSQYMAHADNRKWADFPNINDKEYEALINDLKDILTDIGVLNKSQRVPTNSSRPEKEAVALFNDLLKVISPDENIEGLSEAYKAGVADFLK